MKINIFPLLSGESGAPIEFSYDMPEIPGDTARASGIRTSEPFAVTGVVSVNHLDKLIRFECRAHIEFKTDCARCAREIPSAFELSFSRFVTSDADGEDAESEAFIVTDGEWIDVDEIVCEFLLLELPGKFLCSEDCRGLCTKCGADLNEGDCSCPKKEIDPRLKILDKFFEDGE